MRYWATILFLGLTLLIPVAAQQAPAAAAPLAGAASALAFEVASVKPAPDASSLGAAIMAGQAPHVGTHIDAARVDIGFASLRDLICTAYNVKPYQVNGPDWLTSTRFDILAKLPDGATADQVPAMLQTLLATRFGLTLHRDTRDDSVYMLVVGPGGVQMKPSTPAPDAPVAATQPPSKGTMSFSTGDGQVTVKPGGAPGEMTAVVTGGRGGTVTMSMAGGVMHMSATQLSMPALAEQLTPLVDRPVLDGTGLSGTYQVSLELSMGDLRALMMANAGAMGMMMGGPGSSAALDPPGGAIFASVQKLGLKLDARKAPVQHLVIDHIDKAPTAN